VAALAALPGCGRGTHSTVTLAGSTAFQPFAEKLAERYMVDHPGVQVNVQGGGSAVGIQSALSGAAEIGMADLLDLPPEARVLQATVVARDGIAVVVNPANPVRGVTHEQARGIFTGEIANWSLVGGPDAPIRVICREEGSGTRRSFDALVLRGGSVSPNALFQNSNGTIREAVINDPNAVGYVSTGLVNEKVRALSWDGVEPTLENVKKETYPLTRAVFFLTKETPDPGVTEFIGFVLSQDGQAILEKEGLIPAK
jgi:phosphate transport system substrate-binding protein